MIPQRIIALAEQIADLRIQNAELLAAANAEIKKLQDRIAELEPKQEEPVKNE